MTNDESARHEGVIDCKIDDCDLLNVRDEWRSNGLANVAQSMRDGGLSKQEAWKQLKHVFDVPYSDFLLAWESP